MGTVEFSGQEELRVARTTVGTWLRTHPVVWWDIVLSPGLLVSARLLGATGSLWWLLLPTGLGWPITEYVLHRFVLHLPLGSFRRFHVRHHRSPSEDRYLLTPVSYSTLIAAVYLFVSRVLGGSWPVACLMTGGVLLGFPYFEWSHWAIHHPVQMRTPISRFMRRYHLRHHFIDDQRWFAITWPALIMDVLMGTRRDSIHPADPVRLSAQALSPVRPRDRNFSKDVAEKRGQAGADNAYLYQAGTDLKEFVRRCQNISHGDPEWLMFWRAWEHTQNAASPSCSSDAPTDGIDDACSPPPHALEVSRQAVW